MRSPAFYFAAFFATGIATVSTGALVAIHTPGTTLADAEIGRLVSAQFAGQLIGSYFVGRQVAARLVLGASVAGVAMAALVFAGHLWVPLLFILGLGLGLGMASINTLVGLESPEELRSGRLEMLNVFWPLGAAFCPWLVFHIAGGHTFAVFYSGLALVFLAIAVGAALRRFQPAEPALHAPSTQKPERQVSVFPILLSMLALLAVGVESGLANWLPTFQLRYLAAFSFALPLATLFWVSVLASRVVASRWLRGRAQRVVLTSSSLAAGIASLGLVLFHTPWLVTACVIAAAMAIGPVYPLLLTGAIKLPGRGLVFFCAALGSAAFPWIIGRFAVDVHSLRGALAVPIAGCVMLLLLSLFKAAEAPPEPAAGLRS